MLKRILALILSLLISASALVSCGIEGVGNTPAETPYALFDENGNMLCDYYVLNVLINDVKYESAERYRYTVHRYREIAGVKSWKDSVIYTEKLESFSETLDHVMAVYSSYNTSENSLSGGYYGADSEATALKMVLYSELKNGGVYSSDGEPYFCAEVVGIKKDHIIVSPLDGTIESYISDTLSVSRNTSGLGTTADSLSVGDQIRILYDGGIFMNGINIRGTKYFELLKSEENGFPVSFLGIVSERETNTAEGAENGSEFTDGSVPGTLPVHIVTSASELGAFQDKYTNPLSLVSNNFKYLVDNYTDEYFEDRALIIAYLPSPSMSYTYEIEELAIENGKLTLKISESNAPAVPYHKKMLHAVCIEVNTKKASSLTDFDVTLIN